MEIAVLIVLAAVIILLLGLSFGNRKSQTDRDTRKRGDTDFAAGTHTCPLCGSRLERGERVHSVFYPAPGDTLAEIHGCRYCTGENPEADRFCPVCRRKLPPGEHVTARVFKRPEKTHIHVIGCEGCRPRAGKPTEA